LKIQVKNISKYFMDEEIKGIFCGLTCGVIPHPPSSFVFASARSKKKYYQSGINFHIHFPCFKIEYIYQGNIFIFHLGLG
jgi:hypothetical protein